MIKTLADKPASSIQNLKEDAKKHGYKILDWVPRGCSRCNKFVVQLESPKGGLFYACQCGLRAKYVDRGEGGPLILP